MSEPTAKPSLQMVRMTEEHAAVVAEFYRAVWDPDSTPEEVMRSWQEGGTSNPAAPGQNAPTVLFLSDRRVIGYCSTIPIALWVRGEQRPAYWVKGLMVLPEHRNGPIGYYLVKELVCKLPCALSLTVARPSRRLFQSLGFRELGVISNYIRLLRPGRVATRLDFNRLGMDVSAKLAKAVHAAQMSGVAYLGGSAAGAALSMRRALCSRRGRLEVSVCDQWPDMLELTEPWEDARPHIGAGAVRDGRYLRWRYHLGVTGDYGAVMVRERGRLKGIGVVRKPRPRGDPRLNGIAVATLSELVFSPQRPDVAAAILQGADRVAHEFAADAVLCSTSHPAVERALAHYCYLRAPANMYFLWYDPNNSYSFPTDLRSWWLTRGDMNADEVF